MEKLLLLKCLILLTCCAFGQVRVTGRVVDKQGGPIPDVTVKETQDSLNVKTNQDGFLN